MLRRFGGAFVFACFWFAGGAFAQSTAPVPVRTALLQATTWRGTVQLSATVDAEQDSTLAAERAGRIVAVTFSSGQTVPAGALLVQLDDGPEAAQLALDQARLEESGRESAREAKLMTIAGASQAALDQAEAAQAEARAQVALDQADMAQLRITAPFAGTIGIRKISAGDYLQQGATVASITQTAPLRVLFSVPQTESGGITIGDAFTLSAPSQPEGAASVTGSITALSPLVEQNTNARDAEGVVTGNSQGLLPGMLGTITLQTGAPKPAFLVPTTALNDSVLGRFIFVLQAASGGYTLKTVYVTTYGEAGDDTAVSSVGLAAGQRVVALGGFKLTDGAAVSIESP
jgi:membrane fusion protein (multidrug efflux system)